MFLGAISTFTSYELMDYDKFIKLAVITSMLALPRPTLREKICQGSEILEVLHDDPATKTYLFSFYNSQFKKVIRLEPGRKIFLVFPMLGIYRTRAEKWSFIARSLSLLYPRNANFGLQSATKGKRSFGKWFESTFFQKNVGFNLHQRSYWDTGIVPFTIIYL